MSNRAGAEDLKVFTSTGEDLNPDLSSYLVTEGPRAALIDPGPDWHAEKHLAAIRESVDPDGWLFAVILSPFPGCLSGLRVLSGLTRKRAVFIHWAAAANAGASLAEWRTRSPGDRVGLVSLGAEHRIVLAAPARCSLTGALMGYDRGTQTLFSGSFFGSIGLGRTTGRPVLRRESVRAYTDLFTPGVGPDLVASSFRRELPIARIAPAHGRLAVGGQRLIEALFELDRRIPTVPWAYHRLYLRVAGLLGEDAASALYQAAGIARPDLEQGYASIPIPDDSGARWLVLYERMQQWLSGVALSAVGREMARLSPRLALPVPEPLAGLAATIGESGSREPRDDVRRPPAGARRTGRPRTDHDALTDPVTGLLNETVFDERLAELLADPRGNGVSLLLVGVDNIERINRRYGRSGGDDALHTIAYLLRNYQSAQAGRDYQRVYKLSGPLFGYVLEGTPLADASTIAEGIRQSIAESAMFLEQLTVSIGAVASDEELDGSHADGDPGRSSRPAPDMLVQSARGRLHVARSSGMNTVCSTDPEGVSSLRAGANVLIADPDAPYLEILTRQLAERGYTVLVATDGEDAMDIISQIVPDVIVCEAMLPKINGFAIRERLRHASRLSEIPFVLVSHRKNDELAEKASLLGIVHFLRKPLSLVELVGLLRNLTTGIDA
jgi:diguanylate cyclase (GGDEF)-like protein